MMDVCMFVGLSRKHYWTDFNEIWFVDSWRFRKTHKLLLSRHCHGIGYDMSSIILCFIFNITHVWKYYLVKTLLTDKPFDLVSCSRNIFQNTMSQRLRHFKITRTIYIKTKTIVIRLQVDSPSYMDLS